MPRLIIVGPYAKSLISFRGDLINDFINMGIEVYAIAPEAGFEREFEEKGIKYIPIPLQRSRVNPFNDFHYFASLYRTFCKIKPDIVFCYAVKPVIYGSLAAGLAGIPQIYAMLTGLGYVFTGKSFSKASLRFVVQILYKIALSINEIVFFQNKDDLNEFIVRKLVKREKAVLVNGSGVDTDKFYMAPPKEQAISFYRLPG
jgi:hypothetical protein